MARQDITTTVGNAIIIAEPVTNPDGTVYDFTAAYVQSTVKAANDTATDDSQALARLHWHDGGTMVGIAVNKVTGVVQVTIPPASTGQMVVGKTYLYDVLITDANGNPTTVTWGQIAALPRVTLSAPIP